MSLIILTDTIKRKKILKFVGGSCIEGPGSLKTLGWGRLYGATTPIPNKNFDSTLCGRLLKMASCQREAIETEILK